jgi:hypothetical protein
MNYESFSRWVTHQVIANGAVALDSARITAGCITNLLGNTWRNKIR